MNQGKSIVVLAVLYLSMTGFAAEVDKTDRSSAAAELQKPVFSADGRIACGAKSIWQKPSYGQLMMCIDNDAICTMGEMFNFGKGSISPVFFMNTKDEAVGNSSVSFSGDVRDATVSSDKLGTYKLELSLLDSGLIKIESVCSLNNPALHQVRYFSFRVPPYLKLYGEYSKEGKTVPFDEKSPVSFSGDDLKGCTIRFFPDLPGKSFAIIPDNCSEIKISPASISMSVKGDTFSFLLDIRGKKPVQGTSELSPNGIDFWEVDKLHLPDYGACRNLILNPSFEAGLRYWGYPCFAHDIIPLKYQNFYELDDKEVHSGSHSLRIKALPIKCPLPLGFFTVPYISGEQYTLSFYAKGSFDKNLAVSLWGRELKHPNILSKSVTTFAVDKEWKRYTTPIVPDDRFGGIYFFGQLLSATPDQQEGYVWLDDIQLEKGNLTDFTASPVAAQMVSAARGNFLEFGQKPDFNLIIQSAPDANGMVSISVEDFFFKKIFEDTYRFRTDHAGKSSISLDKLSTDIFKAKLRGVFAVSSVFTITGVDRPFKDYFRFSVMDFLDNTRKNKNLFNFRYLYSLEAGGPDMERFLARERAIGFGSFAYDFGSLGNDLDYPLDKERMQLIEQYGIESMGRPVVKRGGEISEENEAIKMININTRINPADEELAAFENICTVKARNRPWNKIWWFYGESNPGCMPLEGHPDAFAKFLLATLRGVKKGNPQAKVLIEGGPWNMDPKHGTKWVERYIQDTRKIDPNAKFDGAACHHYRDFPEHPDLDSDIAAFLEMLDRNGCKDWPFYINEGGNYCPFNIPQEGISPYICHSANGWYFGPLSYHIGRAERICAAFSARNWLVALKYQSRVKCMQDFGTPGRYMDFDFTPRPYEKMPNTLGRLLGNASFYKDIRFAQYVRCYVFKEDKTGAPIAAIWGYKESVDRWKEDPLLYKFAFGTQDVKFIDLMENEVSYPKESDGRTILPMSPFPLFIKGIPGSEQKLCNAIAAAVPAAGATGGVEIAAFPTAEGSASVVFKNTLSREYSGDAKIIINGVESKFSLKMPSLGSREEQVALVHAAEYGVLEKFSAEYTFSGGSSGKISGDYVLLKNNQASITVDGDLSDWKGVPSIDLGEGISMKAVVADKKVMIAIRATVKDIPAGDVFSGLGLYLDPFEKTETWTEPKTAAGGIAGNLGVYELRKSKGGGLEAVCHFSQGMLAGMDKDLMIVGEVQKLIRAKAALSADAACMEIEIPDKIFAPLTLSAGSRFGINISVPSKKDGLRTLAPIRDFKSPVEPGEISFVMVIVGDIS